MTKVRGDAMSGMRFILGSVCDCSTRHLARDGCAADSIPQYLITTFDWFSATTTIHHTHGQEEGGQPSVFRPTSIGHCDRVMNILFCSVPYRPSIGGIETVSALLAERFHHAGHGVTLVTQTADGGGEIDDFRVVRRPSDKQLFELVRDADMVFHNNISLRFAWPQLLL